MSTSVTRLWTSSPVTSLALNFADLPFINKHMRSWRQSTEHTWFWLSSMDLSDSPTTIVWASSLILLLWYLTGRRSLFEKFFAELYVWERAIIRACPSRMLIAFGLMLLDVSWLLFLSNASFLFVLFHLCLCQNSTGPRRTRLLQFPKILNPIVHPTSFCRRTWA